MDHKTCKYNTSKTSSFVGYCFHPRYEDETCQRFVPCKGLPCDDFEIRVSCDTCVNYGLRGSSISMCDVCVDGSEYEQRKEE